MDNGIITSIYEPTREQLGNVYRYIKAQISNTQYKKDAVITLNRFTQDLQDDKDQIQYNILKLIAMGVLERKLIRTKDNKSMYLYRLLK